MSVATNTTTQPDRGLRAPIEIEDLGVPRPLVEDLFMRRLLIEREAPINASNVAVYNPATGKGDRVGFKTLEDGRKVRIFRSTGEAVDI